MLDILINRRSVRKYKPNGVEKEKVEKLVCSALLSPSSRSIRPWEFIVVDSKELISKLAVSKQHGSAFMRSAPLAIVVLGEPEKSDVWIEDTSILSIIIQIEAETLGLSSCWVQIRNRMHDNDTSSEEFVRRHLEIPDNKSVESIIAVGYADEKIEPYSEADFKFEKVYINKYSNHYLKQ